MNWLPVAQAAAEIDTGDTAWMLAATALVLLMTPALGLFYAGLVRAKNSLNTFMMCIAAIGIAGVMSRTSAVAASIQAVSPASIMRAPA